MSDLPSFDPAGGDDAAAAGPPAAPLPPLSRRRQLRALAGKELALASSRGGVWTAQTVFLAYLTTVLVIGLFAGGEEAGTALRETGRELILVLAHSVYVGALILGPTIGAGAFQEERERGMLEALSAAPVERRDIFIAGVAARVLLLALCCFAAAPLLVVPIAAGAEIPWDAMLRSFAVTLLAATTAILFAVGRTARGHRPAAVAMGLFGLLIFTPLALGIRLRWSILGIGGGSVLLGLGMHQLGLQAEFWAFLGALLQPFSALATVIGGGIGGNPVVAITSIATILLLALRFGIVANREIALWWRREPTTGRLEVHRRRRGGVASERLSQALAAVARHLRDAPPGEPRSEGAETERAPDRDSPLHLPLVATRRIAGAGGIVRAIHRASGRSAFVALRLTEPAALIAPGIAGLGLAAIFTVAFLATNVPPRTRESVEWWTAASVLVIGLFAAIAVARSVPARRRRGSWDALLSAPLSGRGFATGAAWTVVLETWPIVAAALFGQVILAILGADPARAGASVLLFASTAIPAAGVAAHGSLEGKSFAPRMAISFIFFAGLVLPGAILGEDSLAGALSPLRPWIAGKEDRAPAGILVAALAHAAVGGALLALAGVRFAALRRRP